MDHIQGIYREPFSLKHPQVFRIPYGQNIEQIVSSLPLPTDFLGSGVVTINGSAVPRAVWALVKPKTRTADNNPVDLAFHMPAAGGGAGGGDGKDILATVASLALTVATGFIAGGGLAGIFGSAFGAGTFGATALAAGVSLAGSLLLGGLISPPVSSTKSSSFDRPDDLTPASLTGNILAANGPIPRVVGTRRIFPPLAAEPFFYYENDNEYVEAVYALAGPHDLSDIKIDGSLVASADDVEVETREGWDSDTALTVATRQSTINVSQIELSRHIVDTEDRANLNPDLSPSTAVPVWHGMTTGDSPNEVQLQLFFAEGLSRDASNTDEPSAKNN